MKKIWLIVFIITLIVLLGLAFYSDFFLFGSQQFRRGECCNQQNVDVGQGRRTENRMMGSNMMHTRGMNINNEYEFLVHMIPHHEEAVFTAKILKENSEREEMKLFADAIISSQTEEIEKMTVWLETWYPEKDHQIEYNPMMRDLTELKGEEIDIAFLEDMIPHHMEAVMMSQQLLMRRLAEHEEVAVLATEIRNNQRNEIHMMRNWLIEWRNILTSP